MIVVTELAMAILLYDMFMFYLESFTLLAGFLHYGAQTDAAVRQKPFHS